MLFFKDLPWHAGMLACLAGLACWARAWHADSVAPMNVCMQARIRSEKFQET